MTHLDDQSTSSPLLQELFALVSDHGVDSMAHAFSMILNAAMLAERDAALGAGPYERSEQRRGYANGFKSKTVTSRAGKIELRVAVNGRFKCSHRWALHTQPPVMGAL